MDVCAVSSPFQPPVSAGEETESIGGVRYFRTFRCGGGLGISEKDKGLLVKIRKLLTLGKFSRALYEICMKEVPDVIHAHSTFYCAAASYVVSRLVGAKFVYEVRSLWEERAAMASPTLKNKIISRLARFAETVAMRSADHLVVISNGLREDALARGVRPENITQVGNAANLLRVGEVQPTVTEKAVEDWVYGYIGNLSDIEGIDLFIEAVRKLRSEGWRNSVKIFGGGPAAASLKSMANDIEDLFFLGAFSPDAAAVAYSNVDIIVNPRRQSVLTDKVTPLKPLEAMAYRKPVIVSSVAGMLELVEDERNGFIFKTDDCDSLVDTFRRVAATKELVLAVEADAYKYVKDCRSWRANGLLYKSMYMTLCD